MTIRRATVADADDLAALQVASWRSAYAGLLPAEFLAGLDPVARAERWREILTAGSGTTLVSRRADHVVGFCAVGPALDPGSDAPETAESGAGTMYALYVDPSSWGGGIGHSLHEAGLQVLRDDGYGSAGLWVLVGNERAIAFYESRGWRRDGRTQVDRHLAGIALDEIGFSRLL